MSTDASLPPADQPVELPAVELPSDPAQLEQLARQLLAREAQLAAALNQATQTIDQQRDLLDKLTHEMALLKRCLFGSRRERFGADDPRQQLLFAATAALPGDSTAASTGPVEIEDHSPQRRGHGRKRMPPFLPRQTIEHTLPEAELGCPCCGEQRRKISQVLSEQVEHVPASLFVIEHVQVTYACAKCQEQV